MSLATNVAAAKRASEKLEAAAKATELPLAPYADDPVRFAVEILKIVPWARQEEILRAVAEHPRVAVRSGHKIGKSNTAAILALWWWATRPFSRVVMTSPTDRQVNSILFREVKRLHRRARLGGTLHKVADAGLKADDGREVWGFASNTPERVSGISGEHMLFICDEASGIDDELFDGLEGNRAGGAKIVMFSNPTRVSGYFHRAFHGAREFWHTIHVSSVESPNVVAGKVVIPGLATREWVEEKRKEWGDQSSTYWARVLGAFPTQSDNSIISVGLVEEAQQRYRAFASNADESELFRRFKKLGDEKDCELHIGADIARFGDDSTVIYPRRGKVIYPAIVLHGLDVIDVAGKVLEVALAHQTSHIRRKPRGDGLGQFVLDEEWREMETPVVKIDTIGIGAGVYDALKRDKRVRVVGVNVSESPTDETYYRLRDELWFILREFIRNGGAIPDDQMLAAELVEPKYAFTSLGQRIQIESKDELKKRLGRSPDRADALALAIYSPKPKIARVGGSFL